MMRVTLPNVISSLVSKKKGRISLPLFYICSA